MTISNLMGRCKLLINSMKGGGNPVYDQIPNENRKSTKYNKPEAAIEGVQASVDALKLVSGGWCLKIEIVFGNI